MSTATRAPPVVAHCGFRRARQIAGIMVPTRNIIIRNNGIFQNHVTGVIAAIAIPNPIMQTRDTASLPPLMRNASFSVRGVRRRAWDSSSAMSLLCAMLSAKHSVNSWQSRLRTGCAPRWLESSRDLRVASPAFCRTMALSLPTINIDMVSTDACYESPMTLLPAGKLGSQPPRIPRSSWF